MSPPTKKFAVVPVHFDGEHYVSASEIYAVLPVTPAKIASLKSALAVYRAARALTPAPGEIVFFDHSLYYYGIGELQLEAPGERLDQRHARRILFLGEGEEEISPPFSDEEEAAYGAIADRLAGLRSEEGWGLFDENPFEGALEMRVECDRLTVSGLDSCDMFWTAYVKHTDIELATQPLDAATMSDWEEALA